MVKIVKNSSEDFQLHITSLSGSSLLKSISFPSEEDAKAILTKTRLNPVFERKTNHKGKFVISLKTSTGEHVGHSNTYSSEAGMENGIKNLMKSLSTS